MKKTEEAKRDDERSIHDAITHLRAAQAYQRLDSVDPQGNMDGKSYRAQRNRHLAWAAYHIAEIKDGRSQQFSQGKEDACHIACDTKFDSVRAACQDAYPPCIQQAGDDDDKQKACMETLRVCCNDAGVTWNKCNSDCAASSSQKGLKKKKAPVKKKRKS